MRPTAMRTRLAHWKGSLTGTSQTACCRTEQTSARPLQSEGLAAAQLAAVQRELADRRSTSHETAAGVRCLFNWIFSRRVATWQGVCKQPALHEALAHTSCSEQRLHAHAASLDWPQHRHSRELRAAQHRTHPFRHPALGQQQRAARSLSIYGSAHAHGATFQAGMSVAGSNGWRGLHSSSRAEWQPSQQARQQESTSPGQHQQARCEPLEWDEEPQAGPGLKPQPLDWDERPSQAGRPQPLQHSRVHRPPALHERLRPGMQPQAPPRPYSRPGQGAAPGQGGRWQQAGQAPAGGPPPAAGPPVRRPPAWHDAPRPQQPLPQRMLRPPWQAPAGAALPSPPPPGVPAKADAALPPDADVRLVYGEAGEHKVMSYAAAAKHAERAGLDLLSVAPQAAPPVYRLGHADKAAAAARAREREVRKREVVERRKNTLKEVRVGPKTAAADLAVKLRQARGFIEKGHRVKATVPFKAPERGAAQAMLARLREVAAEFAAVAEPHATERLPRNTVAIYLSPP